MCIETSSESFCKESSAIYLIERPVQWNLSIADMLYGGHLSIADTLSKNQFSLSMVKLLYFEPLYSGHLSIADTFSENQWCPLLRGFTVYEEQERNRVSV